LKIDWKLVQKTAAALLLAFSCAEGSAVSINHWNRWKSERLLQDIRALRIGQSTRSEIDPILENYHVEKASAYATSCVGGADSSLAVRISNETLVKVETALPWLRALGDRPWRASGTFLFHQKRLCFVIYEINYWPRNNYDVELSPQLVLAPSSDDLFIAIGDRQNHRYGITNAVHQDTIRRLNVTIAPDATETERSHAFDFDLSCLTSFRPCQTVGQFMPAAWDDYVAKLRSQGEAPNGIDE
jgi:hypothetical protein